MKSTFSGRRALSECLRGHALRKTTEPSRAGDLVTGTKPLNVFAAGDDNPGGVHSGYVRESRPLLIATANHQLIGEADAGRVYIDQNLIRPGSRFSRLIPWKPLQNTARMHSSVV